MASERHATGAARYGDVAAVPSVEGTKDHCRREAEQSPQTGWPFEGQHGAAAGLPGGARYRHPSYPVVRRGQIERSSDARRVRTAIGLVCESTSANVGAIQVAGREIETVRKGWVE